MKTKHFFLLLPFIAACSGSALAGTASTTAVEKSASTPGVQEDIGDIRSVEGDEAKPQFHATAQATSEFVSNAKLQGEHSSGDVLWLPTVQATYDVPLTKQVTLSLLGRTESVLYSDFVEHSFYGFMGDATVSYQHQTNQPTLYASVEPYWYQSLDTGDQVASAVGFIGGVSQAIPLGRGLNLLFWDARYANYQASPDNDDRHQYRLLIGLSHQFRPALYGQIYYTWQYSDYYNFGARHDSRNAVAASVIYQFTKSLFGSVLASFVDNDSSERLADYQNATAGLALTWQF